jgi:hypothetical protein
LRNIHPAFSHSLVRGTSAHDLEGAAPISTEPKDRKIIVECGNKLDAQSLRHCKAGRVNDREVLVWKRLTDCPDHLEIGGDNRLYRCYSSMQAVPKSLCRTSTQTVLKKEPAFDQHMICCDQTLSGGANDLGPGVAAIRVSAAAYRAEVSTNRLTGPRRCDLAPQQLLA